MICDVANGKLAESLHCLYLGQTTAREPRGKRMIRRRNIKLDPVIVATALLVGAASIAVALTFTVGG